LRELDQAPLGHFELDASQRKLGPGKAQQARFKQRWAYRSRCRAERGQPQFRLEHGTPKAGGAGVCYLKVADQRLAKLGFA
jgi:hypothetical protein